MILRETVVYLKHRTISWVPSLKTLKAGRQTITSCLRPPTGGGRKSSGTSDKAKARLMLYGLIEVVAWGSLSLRALVIAVALQS
jgi:hypothetical protein